MHVTGKCFCGYVQFEAEIIEGSVVICHCTTCQGNSGSAFRVNAMVKGDSFKVTAGETQAYEKLADSGTMRSRPFCPKCGTQILSTPLPAGSSFQTLRVGTLDQRDQLVPKLQVWCRSAQPWALIDSLPQFETQPSADEIAQVMGK